MKTWYKVIIAIVVPVVIILYLLLFHTNLIIISHPGSNVYVEDLTWTNVTLINETTYRVSLSMNITYRYKESYMHANQAKPLPEDMPVKIQVFSKNLNGEVRNKDREMPFSDNITLQYREVYPYECSFDLETGKDHGISVDVFWKEFFATPHPYYGEWRWEMLGGAATEIDLT